MGRGNKKQQAKLSANTVQLPLALVVNLIDLNGDKDDDATRRCGQNVACFTENLELRNED